MEPGDYVQEWFELPGELGAYVASGSIQVEVAAEAPPNRPPRLTARDASTPHRWSLAGDVPALVLLTVVHPREAGAAASTVLELGRNTLSTTSSGLLEGPR